MDPSWLARKEHYGPGEEDLAVLHPPEIRVPIKLCYLNGDATAAAVMSSAGFGAIGGGGGGGVGGIGTRSSSGVLSATSSPLTNAEAKRMHKLIQEGEAKRHKSFVLFRRSMCLSLHPRSYLFL